MLFSVYYHSQENGKYLRRVIDASGIGQLHNFKDLSALTTEPGTDVVLLEYLDNNPHLDRWIASATVAAKHPEIFLFIKEMSVHILWKALRLGARECFVGAIQPEDFRAAVRRAAAGHATQSRLNSLYW